MLRRQVKIKTTELSKLSSQYQDLYDNAPDMFVSVDADSAEILTCNQRLADNLGYKKAELIGRPIFLVYHPDCLEQVNIIFNLFVTTGEVNNKELQLRRKDGSKIDVELNVTAVRDESGKVIYSRSSWRDIGERKQHEKSIKISNARMNHAQRLAKIGSWELDIMTGKLWWSDEVYRIFELNPDKFEASYENFLNALHPDDHDAVNKNYTESVKNKTPYNIVHRLHMADGLIKYVNEHCETYYDECDNPIRSIGSIQDITEQTKIEDERLKLQSQLEHTQRLKSLGILAGGIAHDFNNILTVIMGNAALAEYQVQSNQYDMKKYLANIVISSEKAANLCKQMLAYSGKGKFEVCAIHLSHVVKETSQLLEVSIPKDITLKYHLNEDLPLVDADVAQIQQVIMNLVINASDAIGEKSGIISIVTDVMDVDASYLRETSRDDDLPDGSYVYLEVSDTGCGMSKDIQSHLFDPFFTTKFIGHGLGMSAVQGIVRGHLGAIKVYSEVGHGSTFKMLLPISEKTQLYEKDNTNLSLINKPASHVKGKILVVDDEASIREVASLMLDKMGYETLTATDGQNAVEIYQQNQDEIVAVLLDMTMPIMDGKTCFRELKRINKNVKVILSSGYNEQEATSLFTGKGLAGFIQKPYSFIFMVKKFKEIFGA
ncbi:MAG: PAS domain-containing protein [Mariprofundales bacterium]